MGCLVYDRGKSFGTEHGLPFHSSDDVSASGAKIDAHSTKRTVKTFTIKDFVITSSLGQRDDVKLVTASEASNETSDDVEPASRKQAQSETWYQQLYLPVVDALLGQLEMRFTKDVFAVARAVDAVFNCDVKGIEPLIRQCGTSLEINAKEVSGVTGTRGPRTKYAGGLLPFLPLPSRPIPFKGLPPPAESD